MIGYRSHIELDHAIKHRRVFLRAHWTVRLRRWIRRVTVGIF
jgi:hypothetical protein